MGDALFQIFESVQFEAQVHTIPWGRDGGKRRGDQATLYRKEKKQEEYFVELKWATNHRFFRIVVK